MTVGRSNEPEALQTLLRQVNPGRTSELIVEQIRGLIHEGRLRPGDRLPAERRLCVLFGVSRVPLREAMRILESRGLIEIRIGSRGGAFVTVPSGEHIGRGLTDLLALSTLDARDVTEVREVLELGMIGEICHHASEADLDELEALCHAATAAMHDGTYSIEFSARFHARLGRCAHNRALDLVIDSLRDPIRTSLQQARHLAPEMGVRGNEEHLALVAALRARDACGAEAILREHLTRTAKRVAQG